MTLDYALSELGTAFENFKRVLKRNDPSTYERWKAGGFLIDDNVVSMYPCARDCVPAPDEEDSEECADDMVETHY